MGMILIKLTNNDGEYGFEIISNLEGVQNGRD